MSTELPGYAAAQRQWEAMEPPERGPSECSHCHGKGELPDPTDEDADYVQCQACEGFGLITANGEPYDPGAAELEAEEAADHKRDARLTGDY